MVRELAPLQLQDHVLDVPKAVRSREAQQHLPVSFEGDLLEVFVPVGGAVDSDPPSPPPAAGGLCPPSPEGQQIKRSLHKERPLILTV